MEIIEDSYCFACGKDNPIGLKLPIKLLDNEGGAYILPYKIKNEFQGYKGIVHGGIISTILDELSVYAAASINLKTVTANIEVKFLKPVYVDENITVRARVVEKRGGSWLKVEAELANDEDIKAKSIAILRIVD